MFPRRAFLALPFAAALAGCGGGGPRLSKVRGKVFVNNQPAEGAFVLFHPANDPGGMANKPYATVKADGTFTLTTTSDRPDAGAPPGNYKVSITWPAPKADATKPGAVVQMGTSEKAEGAGEDRLKGKYSAANSTLTATVKDADTDLDPFNLS